MTNLAARRGNWLLRPIIDQSSPKLFCLPYLGAGASMYWRWPRQIGNVEVCLLQPPGRENRLLESAYDDYDRFAADLVSALAPEFDCPFGIFAHCNSVFAAYVLAEHLARANFTPRRLFASSMVPPDQVPFGGVLDVAENQLPNVVAELMRARGVDPSPEVVELSMDAVKGDLKAYRRFTGRTPGSPGCPVTTMSWRDDTQVPPALTGGWDRFGQRRLVLFEGDHWTFLDPPAALLDVIAADLAF